MVIVVTGGIGSGKSQVCDMISGKYGLRVYEADSRVKHLYSEHPVIVDTLERHLECVLRDDEGNFIPSLLADRIFGNEEAVQAVEKIVFPYLIRDFEAFCHRCDGPVVFESATVLEKDAFRDFGDVIVLVDAPVDLRLERACSRDKASRDKVMARMSGQKLMNRISDGTAGSYDGYASILERIDYRIMNTGTVRELESKVDGVMCDILKNRI